MAMSVCPQCGTPVEASATICTACGRALYADPERGDPAQLDPGGTLDKAPPEPEPEQAPAEKQPSPISNVAASFDFDSLRNRWGVEQTPSLLGGLALAAIALLISVPAVFSYLIAGNADTLQKLDAATWLQLALGLAIGGTALLLLAGWQSGAGSSAVEWPNPDLSVGLGIAGFTALFSVLGLFKGLDESFDAQNAWFRFAYVFAFLAVGWFAISRPVPPNVGSLAATSIGIGLVVLGVIGLVIGQIQGLSEDFSTYVSGLSFQGVGTVAMILALAWFLGMRPHTAYAGSRGSSVM